MMPKSGYRFSVDIMVYLSFCSILQPDGIVVWRGTNPAQETKLEQRERVRQNACCPKHLACKWETVSPMRRSKYVARRKKPPWWRGTTAATLQKRVRQPGEGGLGCRSVRFRRGTGLGSGLGYHADEQYLALGTWRFKGT
jgi:hypothetical protein